MKLLIKTILLSVAFALLTSRSGAQAQLTFVPAGEILADIGQHKITMSDFDRDGDQDILAIPHNAHEVRLYFNDGSGYFLRSKAIVDNYSSPETQGFQFLGVEAADVNNDSHDDIIISQHFFRNNKVEGGIVVFLNNGAAEFAKLVSIDVDGMTFDDGVLAVGDIENDGDVDVVLHPFFNSDSSPLPVYTVIFKNDGRGYFTLDTSFVHGRRGGDIYLVDFNKDGYKDLVLAQIEEGQVVIWFNDGQGSYSDSNLKIVPTGIKNRLAIADLNNDGNLDIISDRNKDTLAIHLGNASLEFKPLYIPVKQEITHIATADFNGDALNDILCGSINWISGGKSMLFINEGGRFSNSSLYVFEESNGPGTAVGVGDLDRDHDMDIVFGESQKVYLNADIKTGYVGNLCNGVEAQVAFTSTIRFNSGNFFQAQLSDASGSFEEGIIVGTLNTSLNSGKIDVSIPPDLESGYYKIRINSTSPAISGVSSNDILINQLPLPLLDEDITTCATDTLLTPFIQDADSFSWITPVGTSNAKSVRATVSGNYVLAVTRVQCVHKDTINVTLAGIASAGFQINDLVYNSFPDTVYATLPVTLKLRSGAAANEGQNLVWDGGNGETFLGTSWHATYGESGSYKILLGVSNAHGCYAEASKTIVFAPFFIPNVITPNGDGINDRFIIRASQNQGNRLVIFNRWGKKLFETNAYDNQWPDDDVDSGVYYYTYYTTELENVDNVTVINGWLQILQ